MHPDLLSELKRIERQSPDDITDHADEWLATCELDPELIAERVGWLLAGHYGKPAYDHARIDWDPASCIVLIAALEWMVPCSKQVRLNYAPLVAERLRACVVQVIRLAIEEEEREGGAS